MKKVFLLLTVFGLFLCAGLSAQERFTVQSVVGNVEREVSSGKWEAVKTGEALTVDTVIRTRLNSSLVIKMGERSITVGAMQRGVLNDLVKGSAAGVTINGNVAETDTTRRGSSGGSSSTAAARASEAAAELILLDE
jgi:hypothetical protein